MASSFRTLLILVLAIAVVHGSAQAQARIEHSVFGGSVTFVEPHGTTMQGTMGLTATGRVTNTDYEAMLASGFWYLGGDRLTVTAVAPDIPGSYMTRLYANTPNPFNPRTVIPFELAHEGNVRLELFDLRGRRVDTLIDEPMEAGRHEFIFQPRSLASGVYIYRLVTRDNDIARRMVLVR